ncbi:PepSY domain-containing protein [Corynebacterium stationis]|uniref:PepSY domain-containing protein n=1 Tax=Corynebacterium stationis TaxID=1705 RepID=UPI000952D404|nr:PepSY-associated TM helix domain-containing protein [Corynebacterium stationis]
MKDNVSVKSTIPARRAGGSYGIIHRLHSVAGVFVAPLLVISALSGFIYAFAPTLEKVVYHDEITASSLEPAHPLERQVEAARA